MRRLSLLVVCLVAIQCAGCHKHTLSEFKFKPGMTAADYEKLLGSPTRITTTWVGYTLEDGNELRIYFLKGLKGTERSISEADLYSAAGVRIEELFNLKDLEPATKPTTKPATVPTTMPTTAP